MQYEIAIVEVAGTLVASQHRRVPWPELGKNISELFASLYVFLAANKDIQQKGNNVCIYRDATATSVVLEAGVQVAERFTARREVACTSTPQGTAARTVHKGEYGNLAEAHRGVVIWCKERRRGHAGTAWEVYGDWHEDPALRVVEVYRLLTR